MLTDFHSLRRGVLAEYDQQAKNIERWRSLAAESGLDQDPAAMATDRLAVIAERVSRIQSGRFQMVVAGEAKAGKSTFINAYLGIDILPTDGLQATSAIIEVRHSDSLHLLSTKADGSQQRLDDSSEIATFLRDYAALNDRQRGIPVSAIHRFLLDRCNGRQRPDVTDEAITAFLARPEIREANLDRLPTREFESRIRALICDRQDSWRDIVAQITVHVPLSESLREVQILDTPGLGALGALGPATEEVLENADAIVFLKPITGQSVVSEAFSRLVERETARKPPRPALFLGLTHTALISASERVRKIDAAKTHYGDRMTNVLAFDSLAEVSAHRFAKLIDVRTEIDRLASSDRLDPTLENAWLRAGQNPQEFVARLEESSRFASVREAVDQFGYDAQRQSLSDCTREMQQVYATISSEARRRAADAELSARDRSAYRAQAEEATRSLGAWRKKANNALPPVTLRYVGANGLIQAEFGRPRTRERELRATVGRLGDRPTAEDYYGALSGCLADAESRAREIPAEYVAECEMAIDDVSIDGPMPTVAHVLKPHINLSHLRGQQADFEKKHTRTKKLLWFIPIGKWTDHGAVRNEMEGVLVDLLSDALKKESDQLVTEINDLAKHYESAFLTKVESYQADEKRYGEQLRDAEVSARAAATFRRIESESIRAGNDG